MKTADAIPLQIHNPSRSSTGLAWLSCIAMPVHPVDNHVTRLDLALNMDSPVGDDRLCFVPAQG